MDKGTKLPEKSRQALLGEMMHASHRLNALVENLLNMSRLESGRIHPKLEWCDIEDIFSALKRRFQSDSIQYPITFVLAPDLPFVWIDAGLVEQAVENLIQNAIQHTPPQTSIQVRASMSGTELVVMVQDGPGFPPEAIPRIFEKFYRIPGTATGGTGLGLSITKGLVESLNGSVAVTNLAKGGALFTVRLPVETRSAELEVPNDQSD